MRVCAVQVETQARRHDEGGGLAADAECFQAFECLWQRRDAGGHGESDEQGRAHGAQQREKRDAAQPAQHRKKQQEDESLRRHHLADENREGLQRRDALRPYNGRYGPEYAHRGEVHDVARQAEQDFDQAFEQRENGAAAIAGGQQCHPEQDREDHDLQDVAPGHGVHDAAGHQAENERNLGIGTAEELCRSAAYISQARGQSRAQGQGQQQADQRGQQRCRQEKGGRAQAHPADLAEAATPRDAHRQHGEDQRRDDHQHQAHEQVAQRLNRTRRAGRPPAERYAGRHGQHDLRRQASPEEVQGPKSKVQSTRRPGPWTLDLGLWTFHQRWPHFNLLRSTSK